jgi:SulP family sulfate permease
VKLCEANERVLGKIDKAGIFHALGSQPYHADFSGALGRYAEIDKTQGWR